MTTDYHVAVVSYQRPAIVAERTLTMLTNTGVPPHRITIFINDDDPAALAYQDVAEAFGVNLAATPARNVSEARENVFTHYPPGAHIIQLDDDITELTEALDAKNTRPVANLDAFFRAMFNELHERGLYVWGVAPVPNPYFLKPGRLSEGLKFVIYTFSGYINRPGHPAQGPYNLRTKEDYELSLRAWWYDGAILRHDGVAPKADHYKLPGGAVAIRTAEVEQASVDQLLAHWPGLIRLNTRRKTGVPEVVLNPRKRHPGHPVTTPPPGAAQ